MRKKVNWLSVLKGIIYILIATIFISIKFYDIQTIVNYNGTDFLVSDINYATFQEMFVEIFKVAYTNILFFILFLALGIITIVQGVKRNGN